MANLDKSIQIDVRFVSHFYSCRFTRAVIDDQGTKLLSRLS
jgi:hypothetical protein